jgi:hypothetical protein
MEPRHTPTTLIRVSTDPPPATPRTQEVHVRRPLAEAVFDLDEADLVVLDDGTPDLEETIVEADPEATRVLARVPSRFPPGLGDVELQTLIGQITRELCRADRRAR